MKNFRSKGKTICLKPTQGKIGWPFSGFLCGGQSEVKQIFVFPY